MANEQLTAVATPILPPTPLPDEPNSREAWLCVDALDKEQDR